MPAPEVLADEGFLYVERLGTAGGTELLPAVTHMLGKITAHSAGRHTSRKEKKDWVPRFSTASWNNRMPSAQKTQLRCGWAARGAGWGWTAAGRKRLRHSATAQRASP